jgi:hypothetical protein
MIPFSTYVIISYYQAPPLPRIYSAVENATTSLQKNRTPKKVFFAYSSGKVHIERHFYWTTPGGIGSAGRPFLKFLPCSSTRGKTARGPGGGGGSSAA